MGWSYSTEETQMSITQQVIDQAKVDIRRDIADGTIPADVASFTDLHDHVDANAYLEPLDVQDANAAADALDQWLRNGRP